MIRGLGCDLLEIERVSRLSAYAKGRMFTEDERRQAGKDSTRLAGDFAVKEAVAKALGTGFRGFLPADIEVLRDELGCPYVRLYRGARARFELLEGSRVTVSISNSAGLVYAVAVLE